VKAIVLAGGFGTRLQERVPDVPKPMAPVAGRPFLEYVLDHLIEGGIHEIILSVGYRADLIMGHFGHNYRNVVVSYSVETEPLGTGGAIVHALRQEDDDSVLVLNGDTFLNIDYRKLIHWYEQTPAQVAMVLKEVSDAARYGSVLATGERIFGFVEKGKAKAGLINAGVYIVQPSVFETFSLSGKFSFETDLLQRHCNLLSPRAFLTEAYFIDIGVPDDYDRAQYELPSHGYQATRTFH
jgi:D-glycero-alpha-D-manno-heptose 1-phosphate guanylyltransferase